MCDLCATIWLKSKISNKKLLYLEYKMLHHKRRNTSVQLYLKMMKGDKSPHPRLFLNCKDKFPEQRL